MVLTSAHDRQGLVASPMAGAHINVRGAVQGVGFRPFVFKLARDLGLAGSVRNTPSGVSIEIDGKSTSIESFLRRLREEKPPYAIIREVEITHRANSVSGGKFEILESETSGPVSALVQPDLASCPDCVREIFDATNRRHRYPFTNCTHCGPRFSIVEALPYDRANTSMRRFRMCPACAREYADPNDRRFHAQPNACPDCGPQLALWDEEGHVLACRSEALEQTIGALKRGLVVAIKGIGGFQLLADALNGDSVQRLRERKRRPEKPFAVMYPTLESAKLDCEISALEQGLMLSGAAPIVLVAGRPGSRLANSVAPGNPRVGVMLPYSPLHCLLLDGFNGPLVATSGNLSDEPICIDELEALKRLRGIADLFLVHDRPITRPVDDSVVCEMVGCEMVLRRARGYAPLPIELAEPVCPIFAGGAFLKNCVALAREREVFLSQHIGDLGTLQAMEAFGRSAADLPRLYAVSPDFGACDAHPDYPSSVEVKARYAHVISVQHHYAHVLACMAEHRLRAPVLGICWDGTGYGGDGTSWGGEFLAITEESFTRAGHFRKFPLPGGDTAAREPRRSALGAAYAMYGEALFSKKGEPVLEPFSAAELGLISSALARDVNAPVTSSAGRLFDAAASLIGLRDRVSFEGQAAMELEFAADKTEGSSYPYALIGTAPVVYDWQPTLEALRSDVASGVSVGRIASRFHNTLADVIAAIAARIGTRDIVLTGGCFQNKRLLTEAVKRLRLGGFIPHWPQKVPPNDGGIALGQVLAAARSMAIVTNQNPQTTCV